jgi:hypothetical protein
MAQITIPTPQVNADGSVTITFGKESITFSNVTDANFAADAIADEVFSRENLKKIAIALAKRRPALRGKTLNADATAAANLLTVS